MIYRLQRKFILICTISILSVILLVFSLITAFQITSMNRNLDILADSVSEGGGRFPDRMTNMPPPKKEEPREKPDYGFITSETPFSTRHFTVWFDASEQIVRVNTESVHAVTEAEAIALAKKTIHGNPRGWASNYRYKIFQTEKGQAIVFIDGSMNRSAFIQSITITAFVLLGCAALVLMLIILLSKRVVKPIAESYDKQKQFITDANHELKTPLTLILTNLDIAEAELGQNEWLDDIRTSGHRMAELVNQLVALSRMDEENQPTEMTEVAVSDLVADVVSEFDAPAKRLDKSLSSQIDTDILCQGDEALLRRLVSVLLDNAVKYCDEGGEITVTLQKRRQIVLTVENAYAQVHTLSLPRLFDRFYRGDSARTFTGGYGIGLSIAKAIVQKHKGEITAYAKDDTHIGFRVTLKT